MKSVCILVPAGESVLSSVVGPWKVFNMANKLFLKQHPGSTPLFKTHLVGIGSQTDLYGGAFQINATVMLNESPKADLVVIPAINGNLEKELAANSAFLPWIKEQYAAGSEVASFCVGAFILAATGLLKGRRCTTHWAVADQFRQRFPDVELVSEKIITDENGLYTSGGAYSFLNLMIYLLEKYAGREMAILCAKYFEIEIDRTDQLQFSIFRGQREHEDKPILQAQTYIESHVEDKFSVEELAGMYALSNRNFIRRFKKATSNTPLEYIQRAKIEAAKKFFESSPQNVYDVMFRVGYSDSKAFRNLFRKFTGLTPAAYRSKYNRTLATH